LSRAFFRFYAELNDFLPPEKRAVTFPCPFSGKQTVKHLIESLGVPHTEVDLVLVNGQSVPFTYFVADGDRVSVYPVFEAFDVASVSQVRPKPLRQPRFILDAHLGKLAVYLRMLGFDALYRNDYGDEELSEVAASERRILLTKDRGLLKRSAVTHGYCVRGSNYREQLIEVLRRFDLVNSVAPLERCLRCNAMLEPVSKEAVIHRVPPVSRAHYDEFQQCPGCGRIYWGGSHYRRMQRFIEQVLEAAAQRRN
jgi:uncharacterized protein with PIN domain/sulfur carrier protein ThiS